MPPDGCLRSLIGEPGFEKQVSDPFAGWSVEARSFDPDDLSHREFIQTRHRADDAAGGFADKIRRQIAGKQRVYSTTLSVRRSPPSGEYRTDLGAPPGIGDPSSGCARHPFQPYHSEAIEVASMCRKIRTHL